MSLTTEKRHHDYIPWYRLAQEVLGSLIPPLTDEEIRAVAPKRANWFALPLASESNIKEVANRPDPHIDFKLSDNGKSIRIGIRCNTIKSVDKLENILNSFHDQEKADLISEMRKLESDFRTQLMTKIKETNFAQVDGYEVRFEMVTNSVDEHAIDSMFEIARTIRSAGKVRMRAEGRYFNPETPVIDLCFVTVNADPLLFKEKLQKMKRMYEICLSVKTHSELIKELKKREKIEANRVSLTKYICAKCGKEFAPESAQGLRFCDQDGMRIVAVKVPVQRSN